MIVEQVPDFLFSPQNDYIFHFDKDGRFIYMWKYGDEISDALIFIVYDIFFNKYVELTGDSSVKSSEIGASSDSTYKLSVRSFLPINARNVLAVLPANNDAHSHILALIHFDFDQKTYGVLDRISINCQHPTLVCDEDRFGLFFHTCISGEEENELNRQKYGLWTFTIQANQICLADKKLFNYHPLHHFCDPKELHLRREKLWFFHRKDVHIQTAIPPAFRQPDLPWDLGEQNAIISYFDLNEKCPKERQIHEIQLSPNASSQPEITTLQWAQDTLFLQLAQPTFDLLNLLTHKWALNAFECDGHSEPEIENEWVEFAHNNDPSIFWTEFARFHVVNQHFLVAVNRKSKCLHRLAIKSLPKLIDFAWVFALNARLFEEKVKLPIKLPYLPMF